MENFIKPTHNEKHLMDESKIDLFIKNCNKLLQKGKLEFNDAFVYNHGISIPYLNDREFLEAQRQAEKNGYTLTRYPDNYQTTSYKFIETN